MAGICASLSRFTSACRHAASPPLLSPPLLSSPPLPSPLALPSPPTHPSLFHPPNHLTYPRFQPFAPRHHLHLLPLPSACLCQYPFTPSTLPLIPNRPRHQHAPFATQLPYHKPSSSPFLSPPPRHPSIHPSIRPPIRLQVHPTVIRSIRTFVTKPKTKTDIGRIHSHGKGQGEEPPPDNPR
ncbi:hypothetical protein IE53DRAFT_12388 [Violaceomyces palustris]|uniref:Uncharacterized protein n=1 Tax=Violaceomyces palustris TaxID=1673888 RepID=A0ACD0NLL1_9BASI|nr:hypothetical protein IE53DRAFT_12388 [Violaceomyces palustris]